MSSKLQSTAKYRIRQHSSLSKVKSRDDLYRLAAVQLMNPALAMLEGGLEPTGQSPVEIRLSFFTGLLVTLNTDI